MLLLKFRFLYLKLLLKQEKVNTTMNLLYTKTLNKLARRWPSQGCMTWIAGKLKSGTLIQYLIYREATINFKAKTQWNWKIKFE